MPIKIENLTNELVLVRCNSGMTLHLAPRKQSDEIMDVEVTNNPMIKKLQDRRVISLQQVSASSTTKQEKVELTKHKK